jgi:hypothetical protein
MNGSDMHPGLFDITEHITSALMTSTRVGTYSRRHSIRSSPSCRAPQTHSDVFGLRQVTEGTAAVSSSNAGRTSLAINTTDSRADLQPPHRCLWWPCIRVPARARCLGWPRCAGSDQRDVLAVCCRRPIPAAGLPRSSDVGGLTWPCAIFQGGGGRQPGRPRTGDERQVLPRSGDGGTRPCRWPTPQR